MKKKQKEKRAETRITGGSRRRHVIALALLIFAVFLAYSGAIGGTWALDDRLATKSIGIHDLQDLMGFRKVVYLSFLLNQYIAPFNPANFRLFNILLHMLNSVLVYLLAYKTVMLTLHGQESLSRFHEGKNSVSRGSGDTGFYVAVFSSIVFALHPININAVTYIIQRMASMATFFTLLSLLFYISAARTERVPKAILLYGTSGIFLVVGIFSKENALMAVPLFVLYDYIFLARLQRGIFLKRMLVLAVFGVLVVGIASYFLNLPRTLIQLFKLAMNPTQTLQGNVIRATDVYWNPLQHILTEFRVVSRYLLIILIPLPSLFIFDWWGYPLSQGLTTPWTTLPSIFLIAGVFVFGLLVMKKFPFFSFGILWYLIAISLESFVALGSDLYFEHRNYLPSVGLFFGVTAQIVVGLIKHQSGKRLWIAAAIIALLLGSATFERNKVFTDSVSLWSDTVEKAPENLRATNALGNAYLKKSNFEEAKKNYKKVINDAFRLKRAGFFIDASYSLGMIYLFRSQTGDAKKIIDLIEEASEGSHKIEILRAFYLAKTGEDEKALNILQESLRRTARKKAGYNRTLIYTILGDIYQGRKDYSEAELNYNRAIEIDPMFSAAYYGLARVRLLQRNLNGAEELLRKAYDADPENVLVLSDLSDIQLMKKNGEKALEFAKKAALLNSDLPAPYLSMGNVLTYLGRYDDADEYYQEAEIRGLSEVMVIYSKSRSFVLKGDVTTAKTHLEKLLQRKDTPPYLRAIIEKEIGNR
jgi:tetratricopeptide (TPR) repeat protein